ncbi:MAG: aminotransferase class I/II-fold pyridoxal phosphate-dependent enzyme [Hungatella sp.]|jgi:aspartate/methionine/tyrosine aminotransferase|nr:aminotransferase class I/II-fold pyridoxal phosphate-dependent enzyme [Hungatella sp.]
MRIENDYDTCVENLLSEADDKTIFLSNWNKSEEILDFPDNLIARAANQFDTYKNFYVFSDELEEVKRKNAFHFTDGSFTIDASQFAVITNGTSGTYLALNAIRKKVKHIRALLISPVYFTYIRVLQDFHADMFYLQANIKSDDLLSIDILEKEIIKNDINLLILNDPLFGSGLSLSLKLYEQIGDVCEKYKSFFLIDYIYGGMEWSQSTELQNYPLIQFTVQRKRVILVESLCKRVFLNGIKSSTVFSSSEIIADIEKSATSITGSMTYVQLEMFKELYKNENNNMIKEIISKTKKYCSETYELVQRLIRDTGFDLLTCRSGNFCIMGIPKNVLKFSGIEAAVKILKDTNVLVLPHDRYLLLSDDFFYFRINIAMEHSLIRYGIVNLLEKYN